MLSCDCNQTEYFFIIFIGQIISIKLDESLRIPMFAAIQKNIAKILVDQEILNVSIYLNSYH